MEPHEFPQTGPGDVGHAVVRAVLQAIPFGSSAVELLNLVVVPPLERRRDEFIILIADGLNALAVQVQQLQPETLVHNERFISAFAYALPIAIRSHQKEKLEALRNAVLNTALPTAPDEDLQLVFLNYIDMFTPWHVRLLAFFAGRQADHDLLAIRESLAKQQVLPMLIPEQLIEAAYPELRTKAAFINLIIRDLHTRGLLPPFEAPSLFILREPPFITTLGKTFLDFTTSPLEDSTA